MVIVNFALWVRRHSRHPCLIRDSCHFKNNSLSYWQPMKLTAHVRSTSSPWCLQYNMRELILYVLKSVQVAFLGTIQQTITIVQPCTNNGCGNRLRGIDGEQRSDIIIPVIQTEKQEINNARHSKHNHPELERCGLYGPHEAELHNITSIRGLRLNFYARLKIQSSK